MTKASSCLEIVGGALERVTKPQNLILIGEVA
jgi:hypothetical protein